MLVYDGFYKCHLCVLVFLPKIAGVDVGVLKGVSISVSIRNKVLGEPVFEGPVFHVDGVAHNLQWQDGAGFSHINLL